MDPGSGAAVGVMNASKSTMFEPYPAAVTGPPFTGDGEHPPVPFGNRPQRTPGRLSVSPLA